MAVVSDFVAAMRRVVAGWAVRVARGEGLDDVECAAFATWLAARELSGERVLGVYAGDDPSFDTVSGRCGTPPTALDARWRVRDLGAGARSDA